MGGPWLRCRNEMAGRGQQQEGPANAHQRSLTKWHLFCRCFGKCQSVPWATTTRPICRKFWTGFSPPWLKMCLPCVGVRDRASVLRFLFGNFWKDSCSWAVVSGAEDERFGWVYLHLCWPNIISQAMPFALLWLWVASQVLRLLSCFVEFEVSWA